MQSLFARILINKLFGVIKMHGITAVYLIAIGYLMVYIIIWARFYKLLMAYIYISSYKKHL